MEGACVLYEVEIKFKYLIFKYHCFTVHFDSLSFIHTNSCTFSYNYISVFYVILKSLKTLQEALQHVSIFYEIIFREFFIYFLVDVADIKNY